MRVLLTLSGEKIVSFPADCVGCLDTRLSHTGSICYEFCRHNYHRCCGKTLHFLLYNHAHTVADSWPAAAATTSRWERDLVRCYFFHHIKNTAWREKTTERRTRSTTRERSEKGFARTVAYACRASVLCAKMWNQNRLSWFCCVQKPASLGSASYTRSDPAIAYRR